MRRYRPENFRAAGGDQEDARPAGALAPGPRAGDALGPRTLGCRALGFVTLHLDPTAGNTAARRLYEKDSFREARRGLLSGFECVFYEKHLREKELAGVSG
jgi:hypothetical protein